MSVFLAASGTALSQFNEPTRTWNLQSGIAIQGKLIQVDSKHQLVVVEGSEGKSFLHIPQLSRADRKYAESFFADTSRVETEQFVPRGRVLSRASVPEREFTVLNSPQQKPEETATPVSPAIAEPENIYSGAPSGMATPDLQVEAETPVESSLSETIIYSNESAGAPIPATTAQAPQIPWGSTVPGSRYLVTSPYNPEQPLMPYPGAQPGYLLSDPNSGDRLFRIPTDFVPLPPEPVMPRTAVNTGGLATVYSSTKDGNQVTVSSSEPFGNSELNIKSPSQFLVPAQTLDSYSIPGRTGDAIEFDANGIIR
ncbi:MAG: hypothetical protein P1V20_19060 [Verrucomicrobiales bacterium]|nr:hypothetical protein [Verrucomicrobiales bacterium]